MILKDMNEGSQLTAFLNRKTQEVELSGGHRPLDMACQETGHARLCVHDVTLMMQPIDLTHTCHICSILHSPTVLQLTYCLTSLTRHPNANVAQDHVMIFYWESTVPFLLLCCCSTVDVCFVLFL